PCTAPFMAAALGFALTQPALAAILIFVALGIGFAAPFVAVGFSPTLLRWLPKPGAWTTVFRQLLAFPMYATALWLLWVLSIETNPNQLIMAPASALVLTFALWLLGANQHATRNRSRTFVWLAIALVLLSFAALMPLLAARQSGARLQTTV